MSKARTVTRLVSSHRQLEGGGFIVRRPFPVPALQQVDPFLLVDEMGPIDYPPGEAVGAPDHPHRGFETVTYVLEGESEHADSAGHKGFIGQGDVQWMTAGRGVVHAEMPSHRMQKQGGRMHGFQIWVNLPRKDKFIAPRYQEIPSAKLPTATTPDGLARVKVIAGEALGKQAAIETRTPIVYQHWTLQPGASVVQPLPADFNGFVFVFGGAALVGPDAREVKDGMMALLGEGDSVQLAAKEETELLLLAGVPLKEPMVRWGPFVMNEWAELEQAAQDYQAGRMGEIAHQPGAADSRPR
jgi:redox-sensitive bicupin YhaK (pirin superfamily)